MCKNNTDSIHVSFVALSVQSSAGDSWTKPLSYTGSEPNSEVVQSSLHYMLSFALVELLNLMQYFCSVLDFLTITSRLTGLL